MADAGEGGLEAAGGNVAGIGVGGLKATGGWLTDFGVEKTGAAGGMRGVGGGGLVCFDLDLVLYIKGRQRKDLGLGVEKGRV